MVQWDLFLSALEISEDFIMDLFLILGLFIVLASAHNITDFEVPQYGDPRQEAELVCHYTSQPGDPPLHSVKWYRDHEEIFRFTPGQKPTTRTFNNSTGLVTKGACNQDKCTISVILPKRFNAIVAFTCEVSTEGPRFAVAKQTKHLTIAVVLKASPAVVGVPSSAQVGDELLLNCSTVPAMPPANIIWYIDGTAERTEPFVDNTEVTISDDFGLRASWRPLRLRVTSSQNFVSIKCEANQPTKPPFTRSTSVNITVVRSPHLSMFTAYGSATSLRCNFILIFLLLVTKILIIGYINYYYIPMGEYLQKLFE